jgi:imidazolonepropionase
VEGVRKAGKRADSPKVLNVLRDMAAHGTTTVEAKSGYGLTVESELKSLEAIREAAARWPGTVVPQLCSGRMSSQKNFRAAHKSTLRSSVRR